MHKLRVYLREHSLAIVFLVGLSLVLVGIIFAIWTPPHPSISTVLISIGASLIAAAVTTYLSPVTEDVYQRFLGMGVANVYRSRNDIIATQWCEWLRSASERCVLIGIAHNEWCRDAEFEPTLVDRLRHKVHIQVYFLDPNSEIAKKRAQEDVGRDLLNTIRRSIGVMWRIRSTLEAGPRDSFHLYVYNSTPAGTTWIDDFMVATHYLAGVANLTSPAFIVRPVGTRDMYGVYAANARAIQSNATVLEDDNVGKYLPPEEMAL